MENFTINQAMDRLFRKELSIVTRYEFQISHREITNTSYNSATKIISACAEDGRIFLTKLEKLEKNEIPIPTVQISDQPFKKFIWITNHEFVAGGKSEGILLFNIWDSSDKIYHLHKSSTTCLKKENNMLYSGSSDGTIALMDICTKKMVGTANHLYRKKIQPIKDLEIFDNYIYSATAERGRIWLWDIRNLKKQIDLLETNKFHSSLRFVKNNLYSLGNGDISKISANLKHSQTIHKSGDSDLCAGGVIDYLERFDSFIYNSNSYICINDFKSEPIVKKIDGIGGFHVTDRNDVLVFTKKGELLIEKIKPSLKDG